MTTSRPREIHARGFELPVHFFYLVALSLLLVSLVASPTYAAGNVLDLDVPDVELTNQDGETGKFVTDFIGDKVVAVTFTFTTCTTICPVLDGIFLRVQQMLGDEYESEVALLTVSIDPANDIPERLKAHSDKLGVKPGWQFLTGEKKTVTRLLKKLEVYTTDIYSHPPAVFIVDGRRDVWSRLFGFPQSKLVKKGIDAFIAERSSS